MRTRKKIYDMNVAVFDRQNLPALLASGKIAAQADEDYQINQKTVVAYDFQMDLLWASTGRSFMTPMPVGSCLKRRHAAAWFMN